MGTRGGDQGGAEGNSNRGAGRRAGHDRPFSRGEKAPPPYERRRGLARRG